MQEHTASVGESHAFSVDARSFASALARVLPFSSTNDLPTLTAVRLKRSGDQLTLTTTDRFRAAMLVTDAEWGDEVGADWSLVLPREVAKRAVAEWKTARLNRVSVTALGSEAGKTLVRIEDAFGRSIGDTFTEAEFPDVDKILMSQEVSLDPPADHWLMINADYLLDFAKARPQKTTSMEIRWPDKPNKPIHVAIGDDFLGVLMTRRPQNGSLVSDVLKRVGGEA